MAAALAVAIIVIVLDKGQAKSDTLLQMPVSQEAKILLHKGRCAARVAVVDVGIHILHIYIIMMYVGDNGLKTLSRHVERRLQIDVPLLRTELAKLHDEVAVEQGLTASKADAAISSEEVEVVLHQLVHQLLGRRPPPNAFRLPALAVETIAATQRAAVKGHQRSDTLSINGEPMAGDGYERSLHSRLSVIVEDDGQDVLSIYRLAELLTGMPFGHCLDQSQGFLVISRTE